MRESKSDYVIARDGLKIHYTVAGDGPSLLVHPGGPGLHPDIYGDWAGLENRVTLIRLHPRACGKSWCEDSNKSYSLIDYASDIERVRQHLKIKELSILGHSHGGFTALQYALLYPQHTKSLILLHTTASKKHYHGLLSADYSSYQTRPWFSQGIESAKILEDLPHQSGVLTEHWLNVFPFYFYKWDLTLEKHFYDDCYYPINPHPYRYHILQEYDHFNFVPFLKRVTSRALVIAGQHDIFTPLAAAKELTSFLPQAQLSIFDRSAHMAFMEEPTKFCKSVSDFLEGLYGS